MFAVLAIQRIEWRDRPVKCANAGFNCQCFLGLELAVQPTVREPGLARDVGNANTIEAAMEIIAGTARSMGVRIEGREMKIKYVPSKKVAAMLQGKTLED